eukprot:3097227-Pyramimonas_sp.AAC.1
MCSALRGKPHVQNVPPSMREPVVNPDFRSMSGAVVSGEAPIPPYQHLSGCDGEELVKREGDEGGGGG